MTLLKLFLFAAGPIGLALAHGGGHGQQQPIVLAPDADWATRHMAEEHRISSFDAGAFFALHDFDSNGIWDQSEIAKTYGLKDISSKDVPMEKKDEVVNTVLGLLDKDGNGHVSRDEWKEFTAGGGVLPDFGLGPGHHGDDEFEYEIHHWDKYHDENTKEEDLTHPEDIEHFQKHEEVEDEAEKIAEMQKMRIVDVNIPRKFKKFP